MLVSYDWLKDYIGEKMPSPEEVERLLTFHAFEIEGVEEVEGDTVFDVDVLPNRTSDCLCHRGIARELASITGTPLAQDPLREVPALSQTDLITVAIEDESACPRFTASLIRDVEVKESPAWLQARLRAIGQRPINNIVDATNYVMFALGQPLHAYDADLFPQHEGMWQFGVRFAREGEVVALIGEGDADAERDVTLTGSELLIVDRSNDTPVGLAGVKGGRYAGIHEGTQNVIIEAAHFDPVRTRKTARRLGIVIDASKRFENEPSRELPPYAQREIAALIEQIAGGSSAGVLDQYLKKQERTAVAVRAERVNAVLGLSLEKAEMADILSRIGAELTLTKDGFSLIAPFERSDLNIEEDYIEEIGRIHGYEHIASVTPEPVDLTEYNAQQFYSERVRRTLTGLGFSEVITSSFRKKDEVCLYNALASDKQCLRSSLFRNIEEALEKNIRFVDLLGLSDVRIFEIGTVFTKDENGITEHVSLCLGVRSKASGHSKKDDELLQEAIGELTITLDANLSFDIKNGIAEMNLTELLATLPEPESYDPIESIGEVQYKPYSPYPHVSRDIALWVGAGTTPEEVEELLNTHAGQLRVRTTLFDEFTKDGRTSYAFRLVFQSDERTLTDDEVNEIMDEVYEALKEKGWEAR